ncbi:double-CXXCG motif protein [Corallococcus exiguus]|uniref:double-CXXCG motif protein n=1 Tax=Corallococcus exiguus TaxID=83462 RepID=UPI0034D2C90D
MPTDLDIFRLTDAATLMVATERFVEAARGLGPLGCCPLQGASRGRRGIGFQA